MANSWNTFQGTMPSWTMENKLRVPLALSIALLSIETFYFRHKLFEHFPIAWIAFKNCISQFQQMNQHNDSVFKGKNGYSKFWISQRGFMREKSTCFSRDLWLDLSNNFYVILANEQKNNPYKCNKALWKTKIYTQPYCLDEWKHRNSDLTLWQLWKNSDLSASLSPCPRTGTSACR